jgi:hypothetical protein
MQVQKVRPTLSTGRIPTPGITPEPLAASVAPPIPAERPVREMKLLSIGENGYSELWGYSSEVSLQDISAPEGLLNRPDDTTYQKNDTFDATTTGIYEAPPLEEESLVLPVSKPKPTRAVAPQPKGKSQAVKGK